MSNLDSMLRSASDDDFKEKLDNLSSPCCESFDNYFNNHIKPDIEKHSGKWLFEEEHMNSPKSGITTHISEGFNSIIKYMNDDKRMPVSNMVLSLFYLYNTSHAEVLKGRTQVKNRI